MNPVLASAKEEVERAEDLLARQVAVVEATKGLDLPTDPAVREFALFQKLLIAAQRKYDFLLVNLPPGSN